MIKEETKEYYIKNAKAWMNNAYLTNDYNYSTPLHRIRVIKNILKAKKDVKTIIDIGCGGALVSIELAKLGYKMTSIDQSDEMLKIAQENISKQPKEVQDLITLKKCSVDEINFEPHDCAIAMGLIGYLNSDDELFKIVKPSLKKEGTLIVSFRNRLFNLFSISFRTINESKQGTLQDLVDEASTYYQRISEEKTYDFIKYLNEITNEILNNKTKYSDDEKDKEIKFTYDIEPRQTTPIQAKNTAEKYGFELENTIGIHPHFALAGLNKNLPPTIYNKLCDSFIPFENEEIAKLWSSVFIGVFKNV